MGKPTRFFYGGAEDSMNAPFEPKTPCRNFETRPCVVLTTDDRQRFPRSECLPHKCARFPDRYEEPNIPHDWEMNGNSPAYHEMGDYHGGVHCIRCNGYFCQHCDPKVFTAVCPVQDANLF